MDEVCGMVIMIAALSQFQTIPRRCRVRKHLDSLMSTRRDFLKRVGSMGLGPALASRLHGRAEAAGLAGSQSVKTGKAQHLTILHTSDIHAHLEIHDELFYEQARPAFRRRRGFATLRTMINARRRENPQHTSLVYG